MNNETHRMTYTFGDAPKSLINARLPRQYEMALNQTDMVNLLDTLLVACGQIDVTDRARLDELSDWAAGMRGSILETLGIEEI